MSPMPAIRWPPASIPTSGGVGAQLADVATAMLAEDIGHGDVRVRRGQDRLDLAPRGHLSGTDRWRPSRLRGRLRDLYSALTAGRERLPRGVRTAPSGPRRPTTGPLPMMSSRTCTDERRTRRAGPRAGGAGAGRGTDGAGGSRVGQAEEAAEDDPGAAAEVERCRRQHATAEAAAGVARARRREIEAQLEPAEVARAYSPLTGGGRG